MSRAGPVQAKLWGGEEVWGWILLTSCQRHTDDKQEVLSVPIKDKLS